MQFKLYSVAFYSVFIYFFCHNLSFAMDSEYKTISTHGEQSSEKAHDPMFFELTTHNNRKVYVIGSNHIIQPDILFTKIVFDKLELLSKEAILFTEHSDIYNHLKSNLSNEQSDKLWEDDKYVNSVRSKTWNYIKKNEYRFDSNIPIQSIQNLPPHIGIMLFYSYASNEFRKRFGGFESTLREWKEHGRWKGDIIYLEDVDKLLENLKNDEAGIKSFLDTALINYSKIIYYDGSEEHKKNAIRVVKENLDRDIDRYRYDMYSKENANGESIATRNKEWAVKVANYLKETIHDNTPIVIVCGAKHLKGCKIVQNTSFLKFLQDTTLFKSIYRIKKDGETAEL